MYRPVQVLTGCAVAGLLLGFAVSSMAAEQVLRDFRKKVDLTTIKTEGAKLSQGDGGLRMTTSAKADWPGITLKPSKGPWDLNDCAFVAVELKNVGENAVKVSCRVDNPGADGAKHCVTHSVDLPAGEQQVLKVPLKHSLPAALRGKLFGMRGLPGGWVDNDGFDAANVTALLVFVPKPKEEHTVLITAITAGGETPVLPPSDPAALFPMIDQFGQYMHKDWPGKIKSAEEFATRKQAEDKDLAAHPGPADWDQYGGWKAGPQLTASGFFRVQKQGDKWWLVDPEGRLFWSHGIDCLQGANATTPITDREHWFAGLPEKKPPFDQFFGHSGWAPHGYYQGKSYTTFNFTGANLLRKYGPQWKSTYAELAHRRLRSWGLNTIANWSDPGIYGLRKTPYTANVWAHGPQIRGSEGYWGKFDDVFDPQFEQSLRKAMADERGRSAGDPWCLGYFIGNELSWGNDTSLALAALHSPADQPAKRTLVDDLKKKYDTIAALNKAWDSKYETWDALLSDTESKEHKGARDDLRAFYSRLAEEYFRICQKVVKEIAPNQLYLGCRFAWTNELAQRAAAKYCDVVSFNRYKRTVADLQLPEGCDKPLVIGEFHFGALDRGMFHTGLVSTANQDERAEAYKAYVRSALGNPAIVGTHWFQFADQATTGRGDGENYQIGFLDCCDTPYGETVEACREIATQLYKSR